MFNSLVSCLRPQSYFDTLNVWLNVNILKFELRCLIVLPVPVPIVSIDNKISAFEQSIIHVKEITII